MFFAEQPLVLAWAQRVCLPCPARRQCLLGALQHGEPWGVWGGEIFQAGAVVEGKRARGRPRRTGVV